MIKVRQTENITGELPKGITWMIIGQPKTGKSTCAANWHGKVLIIDSDHGLDFLDKNNADIISVWSINTPMRNKIDEKGKKVYDNGREVMEPVPLEERTPVYIAGNKLPPYSLAEIIVWLDKEWVNLGYDTIVMDTINKINEWIEDEVCREAGIRSISELGFGVGFDLAKKKNLNAIRKLQELVQRNGAHFVELCHSKQTTVIDEKKKMTVQLGPELPGKLGIAVTAQADVIGYTTINSKTGKPEITFDNYDEKTIGSRIKALHGKTMPLSWNEIAKTIVEYKGE